MTTFMFVLTPEAGDAVAERAMIELEAAFPEHEFLLGDFDLIPFENSITAIRGSGDEPGSVTLPVAKDIEQVKSVFRGILDDLREWKPS